MLPLFLNSVTVRGLFDKVYVSRVSRLDNNLVHEISRSFLSRSTKSVKKKKEKNFQPSVVKLTR